MKKIFLFGIIIILLFGGLFLSSNQIKKESYPDCSEFGVIYLTEAEVSLASDIARDFNGIVVIPELNQMIGDSEYLKCNNFDYRRFIIQ